MIDSFLTNMMLFYLKVLKSTSPLFVWPGMMRRVLLIETSAQFLGFW